MDVVGCKFLAEGACGTQEGLMATVSKDRTLCLYDMESRAPVFCLTEPEGDPFTSLACPRGGSADVLLCTSTFSGELGVLSPKLDVVAKTEAEASTAAMVR